MVVWIKDLEGITDIIPKKRKQIRRTGRALKAKRDAVKRLKAQNMTIKQIAEQLEAPIDTVKKWLYKNR